MDRDMTCNCHNPTPGSNHITIFKPSTHDSILVLAVYRKDCPVHGLIVDGVRCSAPQEQKKEKWDQDLSEHIWSLMQAPEGTIEMSISG